MNNNVSTLSTKLLSITIVLSFILSSLALLIIQPDLSGIQNSEGTRAAGTGWTQWAENITSDSDVRDIESANFDLDATMELVYVNSSGYLAVYERDGPNSFPATQTWYANPGGNGDAICIGSVDYDQDPEIYYADGDSNVYVYEYVENTPWTFNLVATIDDSTIDDPNAVAVGDFDGSGNYDNDVAIAYGNSVEFGVGIWEWNGYSGSPHTSHTYTKRDEVTFATDDYRAVKGADDLDGDGIDEIVLGGLETKLRIIESNGGDAYGETANVEISDNVEYNDNIYIFDFDGDTEDEIVVGCADGNLNIIECIGRDSYKAHTIDLNASSDGVIYGLCGGDSDGDGNNEVYVATADDRVYCVEHDGSFNRYTGSDVTITDIFISDDSQDVLDTCSFMDDEYLYSEDFDGDDYREVMASEVTGIGGEIFVIESDTLYDYAPDAPVLNTPFDNERFSDTTPVLNWSVPEDVDDATLHFKVEWDDDSDFITPIATKESSVSTTGFSPTPALAEGTGTCEYTIQSADELDNETYWWRVAAHDGNRYGDWSEARSFTVDPTVTQSDWFQNMSDQFKTGDLVQDTFTTYRNQVEGGDIILYDDFEDYSSGEHFEDNWIVTEDDGSVSWSTTYNSPTHSVRNWDNIATADGDSTSFSKSFTRTSAGTLEIHPRLSAIQEMAKAPIFSVYSDSTLKGEMYFNKSDTNLIWNDGTENILQGYTTSFWHDIRLEFDAVADSVVCIVDDVNRGTYNFQNSGVQDINKIAVISPDVNTSTTYTDDIKINITQPTYCRIYSSWIDFDDGPGDAWGHVYWNENLTDTNGDIRVWVLYEDPGGDRTNVLDSVLPGNSAGFTDGVTGIDIRGLDTIDHNRILLLARFTYSSGTPKLDNWTVTWDTKPKVVINEVSPAGSGNDEWIELYNADSSNITLDGMTLDDLDGNEFTFTNIGFHEDFSEALNGSWTTYESVPATARNYRFDYPGVGWIWRMDKGGSPGEYNLNELTLEVNASTYANLELSFGTKEASSGEDVHTMPDTFTTHNNSDGIAVSNDGTNWVKLWQYDGTPNVWVNRGPLDIGAVLSWTDKVYIRFQQYDDQPLGIDGIEWDNIFLNVTTLEPGESIKVYTGTGTNATGVRYWQQSSGISVWNDDGDDVLLRDGYLQIDYMGYVGGSGGDNDFDGKPSGTLWTTDGTGPGGHVQTPDAGLTTYRNPDGFDTDKASDWFALTNQLYEVVSMTPGDLGDRFGWNVSSAGDVNNDGYDDTIVGAPGYNTSQGRAYIFYGNGSFSGDIDPDVADVVLTGLSPYDGFGHSVSSAGDMNGDGIDDVIVGAPTDPGDPNWLSGWDHRMKLTFDNSGQSDDLDYFPVLVVLNTTNFDYAKVKGDGSDIRFIDSDDTTVLKYHIESWNPSGTSYIWVNVTKIDGDSDTDYMWLYYGNSGASDVQDVENTYNSNYVGVWHMNETSGTIFDSTDNDNDGSSTIDGIGTLDATGKIGGGNYLDGTNDEIIVSSPSNMDDLPVGTLSFWVNVKDRDDDNDAFIYFRELAYEDYLNFRIWADRIRPLAERNNAVVWNVNVNSYIDENVWVHHAFVQNGTEWAYYKNGVDVGFQTSTNDTFTGDLTLTDLYIGTSHNGFGDHLNATFDEVQVSNTNRSADWIKAEYLSGMNEFIDYGNEAPAPSSNGVGAAYVFYGGSMTSESASGADLTFTGTSGTRFGCSVAGVGNVDNANYDDVIVGAYLDDVWTTNGGAAYIYSGDGDNEKDFTLYGTTANGNLGFAVGAAGDVNDDNIADIIVGAPGEDKAYIFYGGPIIGGNIQRICCTDDPTNVSSYGEIDQVTGPSFVYHEDFEDALDGRWSTWSSDATYGQNIRNTTTAATGSYAWEMDVTFGTHFNSNSLTLQLDDMSVYDNVRVSFYTREYSDYDAIMPETFSTVTGTGGFDGVAVSNDGENWTRLFGYPTTTVSSWTHFGPFIVQDKISWTDTVYIRFSQRGLSPNPNDGIWWDDIFVNASKLTHELTHTQDDYTIFEDFEDALDSSWSTYNSDGTYGRNERNSSNSYTGSYSWGMDVNEDDHYNLNELVLQIDDTDDINCIELTFHTKDEQDEQNLMSDSFTDHENSDGVAVSNDGTNWVKLWQYPDEFAQPFSWQPIGPLSIEDVLDWNDTVYIKFQQYDNYQMTTDGILWDDIYVNISSSQILNETSPSTYDYMTYQNEYIDKTGTLSIFEDFEDDLDSRWSTYNNNSYGRNRRTTIYTPNTGLYSWQMDTSINAYYNLNELIFEFNASSFSEITVTLHSWEPHTDGDTDHTMPNSFTDHNYSDGVAVSNDGTNWEKLWQHGSCISTWTLFGPFNVHDEISWTDTVYIKFQQYDYRMIHNDGILWDDIWINCSSSNKKGWVDSTEWAATGGLDDDSTYTLMEENTNAAGASWQSLFDETWSGTTDSTWTGDDDGETGPSDEWWNVSQDTGDTGDIQVDALQSPPSTNVLYIQDADQGWSGQYAEAHYGGAENWFDLSFASDGYINLSSKCDFGNWETLFDESWSGTTDSTWTGDDDSETGPSDEWWNVSQDTGDTGDIQVDSLQSPPSTNVLYIQDADLGWSGQYAEAHYGGAENWFDLSDITDGYINLSSKCDIATGTSWQNLFTETWSGSTDTTWTGDDDGETGPSDEYWVVNDLSGEEDDIEVDTDQSPPSTNALEIAETDNWNVGTVEARYNGGNNWFDLSGFNDGYINFSYCNDMGPGEGWRLDVTRNGGSGWVNVYERTTDQTSWTTYSYQLQSADLVSNFGFRFDQISNKDSEWCAFDDITLDVATTTTEGWRLNITRDSGSTWANTVIEVTSDESSWTSHSYQLVSADLVSGFGFRIQTKTAADTSWCAFDNIKVQVFNNTADGWRLNVTRDGGSTWANTVIEVTTNESSWTSHSYQLVSADFVSGFGFRIQTKTDHAGEWCAFDDITLEAIISGTPNYEMDIEIIIDGSPDAYAYYLEYEYQVSVNEDFNLSIWNHTSEDWEFFATLDNTGALSAVHTALNSYQIGDIYDATNRVWLRIEGKTETGDTNNDTVDFDYIRVNATADHYNLEMIYEFDFLWMPTTSIDVSIRARYEDSGGETVSILVYDFDTDKAFEDPSGGAQTITQGVGFNWYNFTLTGDYVNDTTGIVLIKYVSDTYGSGDLNKGILSIEYHALNITIPSANVTLVGENSGDNFGWSVGGEGILNAGSTEDVIVGAPDFSSSTGRSYAFYGGSMPSSIDASNADVIFNGSTAGDKFGYSVGCDAGINTVTDSIYKTMSIYEDFTDDLNGSWTIYMSNTTKGRNYMFDHPTWGPIWRMGCAGPIGVYNLNELIVEVNASEYYDLQLTLMSDEADLGDDVHLMPDTFTGHNNSDGIAVSNDGENWTKVWQYDGTPGGWAVHGPFAIQDNITWTDKVYIKIQQYDDTWFNSDGIEWDNIWINGSSRIPTQTFEAGLDTRLWSNYSTGNGNNTVSNYSANTGNYSYSMDSTSSWALNELIMGFDASTYTSIELWFAYRHYNEENNYMSDVFVGHENSDGVAVSNDGENWIRLWQYTMVGSGWRAPSDAPFYIEDVLTWTDMVYIKFQQYDGSPIPIDGLLWDDICVNTSRSTDVIIGAPDSDTGGTDAGSLYTYLGGDFGNWAPASEADFINNGEAAGDRFGWSVSDTGNVNNDNYGDIAVGAPYAFSDAGEAYILSYIVPMLGITAFTATENTTDSIDVDLDWGGLSGAIRYNVYRAPTPYSFDFDAPYVEISAPTTSWTDTSAPRNTMNPHNATVYYYAIKAVNERFVEGPSKITAIYRMDLVPGWNLVPWFSLETKDIETEAFASLEADDGTNPTTYEYDKVERWDPANQVWDSYTTNGDLGPFDTMDAGYAYAVQCNKTCLWTYSEDCGVYTLNSLSFTSLSSPTNFKLFRNGLDPNQVNLTWDEVTDAHHYNIYRSTTKWDFDFSSPTFTSTDTSYVDTTATQENGEYNQSVYYYIVRAADAWGRTDDNWNVVGMHRMDFREGYNYISWIVQDSVAITEVLANLTFFVDYFTIVHWNETAQDWNISIPGIIDEFTTFDPGYGYAILTGQACTWTYVEYS